MSNISGGALVFVKPLGGEKPFPTLTLPRYMDTDERARLIAEMFKHYDDFRVRVTDAGMSVSVTFAPHFVQEYRS